MERTAKWTCFKHAVMNGTAKRTHVNQAAPQKAPAHGICIEAVGPPVVNDDDLMVLVQETLQGSFRRVGNAARVAGPGTGPPEAITLAVFLRKDQ